jgi:hypothetical protein
MIIKGRSRSGADELAAHLARVDTNERMEVIEVRGTVAADVKGALREMVAVAVGTRCKSSLYHASVNVRAEERMDADQWRFAIDTLESKLGLIGQPRVVVMHEKLGREHVHIVWSRIDAARMCAISDSHNYRAHEEAARELERVFGHEHTQGAHHEREGVARPGRTASHADQQQASRHRMRLSDLTTEVTGCWRSTQNGVEFRAALEERGYLLGRGERRDFVLIDPKGGIHSLTRRIEGVRVAHLRERMRDIDLTSVPSVERAREMQSTRVAERALDVESAARSPFTIFGEVLRTRSYVTEGELRRAFESAGMASDASLTVIDEASETLRLYTSSGSFAGYTTAAIRAEEASLIATATRLAEAHVPWTSEVVSRQACAVHGLDAEQVEAVERVLSAGRVSLLVGRAGSGKSRTLSAIRAIAEREGFETLALAPTNAVAEDLRTSGFSRATTVHSLLWYRTHAPTHANARVAPKTMIVVDEAAMLDTKRLAALVALVDHAGDQVRVVLAGDDRQLASVERGGVFTDLVSRIGAAELSTVRRQERHWARRASEAFSQGRFRDGLEAFAERGLISWSARLGDSRAALLARYERDTAVEAGKRFIFAYTNEEVKRLNDEVQAMEVGRGRVRNVRTFETSRGTLHVGEGDRIAFRGTDKGQGILNGALATVQAIEGSTLRARMDRGKIIEFDVAEFDQIDLGYCGTVYRGQGKTLDEVYLLHTRHWRDAASYVALTRSRRATHVFVARDQAQDFDELVDQVSRQSNRGSTLEFLDAPPVLAASLQRVTADRSRTMGSQPREQERH